MVEVHLAADELALVRRLLAEHVPAANAVHVFGSRATGRFLKPFSDLDLLLDASEPLPSRSLGELQDAFSDSDLPFRVDLVERHGLSPSFAAAIEADGLVPLEAAQPAASS